jgi:hypothetical protein
MRKIIYFAIFLVFIYGGYRYTLAYLNFNRLSSRIDQIISEPQAHTIESMKEYILDEAAKLEITLPVEEIDIEIRETDRASLGETLLERPGIDVESKLLSIQFSYQVEICGISRTYTYDIEKAFTSKTFLVNPYEGDTDR